MADPWSVERPLGLATMALDGAWVATDAPFLLWVFEYVARHRLLTWWRRLPMNEDLPATPKVEVSAADSPEPTRPTG